MLPRIQAMVTRRVLCSPARRAITYRAHRISAYAVGTGTVTESETATSLPAIGRTYTAQEIARLGHLEEGDREYIISKEHLTATPNAQDRILDGTDELQVLRWEEGAGQAYWKITATKYLDGQG